MDWKVGVLTSLGNVFWEEAPAEGGFELVGPEVPPGEPVYVTFAVERLEDDASGTVLVVDGDEEYQELFYSDLPKTFSWVSGGTYSFEWRSPIAVDSGKRYIWVETKGLSTERKDEEFEVSRYGYVIALYKAQHKLTIQVEGEGTTDPSPGEHWYDSGSSVSVQAIPSSDAYEFDHWELDGRNVGPADTYMVTMDRSHVLKAVFAIKTFTLTVKVRESGTSTGIQGATVKIDGTPYMTDSSGKVTATVTYGDHTVEIVSPYELDSGTRHTFTEWSDGSTANPRSLTITDDLTMIAYMKTQYKVTLQTSGLGSDFSGNSITFDGTGYKVYDGHPEAVWVDPGRTVSYTWDSPIDSSTSGKRYVITSTQTGTINVDSAKTVSATYKTQYYLEMRADPSGAGSVSPSSGWRDAGEEVTISATPVKEGYVFKEWDGSGLGSYSGPDNPAEITMNDPITETAYFVSMVEVTFSVNGLSSDGSGTILIVDGEELSYADLPKTFTWLIGSTHSFEWESPISAGLGKQYVWESTSGLSNKQSDTITVPSTGGEVSASYKTQYYLDVKSAWGKDGSMAYYPFDEGSGTTTHDESGNNNHGTIHGATWVGGKFGKALSFDGNDYVVINSLAPIQNTPINKFTFEAWIKYTRDTGAIQQIFEGHTSTGEIYIEGDFPTLTFMIKDDDAVGHTVSTTLTNGLGVWYHIVGTYDGSVQRLFINGEEVASTSWSNTFTITTGISLGKDYEANIQYFNGIIDEVRIYSRVLTKDEIREHYKSNVGLRLSSGWFDAGASVSASVNSPVSGGTGVRYVCIGWVGSGSVPASGSGTSVTFTINAPSSVTWKWKTQYYLTMKVSPSGTGSASPSSSWRDAGSKVTISATPASGYIFEKWVGSGSGSYSGTSNPATITMNAPITETAYFKVAKAEVTFSVNGLGLEVDDEYVLKVDGTSYKKSQLPKTFTWDIDSQHSFEWLSPVPPSYTETQTKQGSTRGGVLYFYFPAPPTSNLELDMLMAGDFGANSEYADIYVNGHYIGKYHTGEDGSTLKKPHPVGSYPSFPIDISSYVTPGQQIEIKVDASYEVNYAPGGGGFYYKYQITISTSQSYSETQTKQGKTAGGVLYFYFPAPSLSNLELDMLMAGDFDYSSEYADVYVNGHYVGRFRTGYQDTTLRRPSGFPVDISSYVTSGQQITIKVDASSEVNYDPGGGFYYKYQITITGSGKQYVWKSTSGLSSQQSDTITVPHTGGSVTATYEMCALPGWQHRKEVIIDNTGYSGTLTDYQVEVYVPYFSGMKGDFSDIRFTDSDKVTLLSYWIQEYAYKSYAIVWVKVPSIPARSTKAIYLYYGNPSAISQSNGDATFIFFDDFNDGWIDTNKWTSISAATESGGVFRGDGGNARSWARTKRTFSAPFEVRFKMRGTVNSDFDSGIKIGNLYFISDRGTGNPAISTGWVYPSGSAGDVVSWHVYRAAVLSRSQEFRDLTANKYATKSYSYSTGYLYLVGDSDSSSRDTLYDWIFVRKHISPDPTVTIEGVTPPPTEPTIQLREFDFYGSSGNPDVRFSKPDATILRIDSYTGGSGSRGMGYVFLNIPRSDLNGKKLRIRWNVYYTYPDSRDLKLGTLYVFNAAFDRKDMTSYFKPGQSREPMLDYTHIEAMHYPGPKGRSGWLGWRTDTSGVLSLSGWSSDYVTVLIKLTDWWSGQRVIVDIDYLQILDSSNNVLKTFHFTGSVSMEQTGTYNDYGVCK